MLTEWCRKSLREKFVYRRRFRRPRGNGVCEMGNPDLDSGRLREARPALRPRVGCGRSQLPVPLFAICRYIPEVKPQKHPVYEIGTDCGDQTQDAGVDVPGSAAQVSTLRARRALVGVQHTDLAVFGIAVAGLQSGRDDYRSPTGLPRDRVTAARVMGSRDR